MENTSNMSILKGQSRPLKPALLHKIFEETATGSSADKNALIFEDGGIHIHSYSSLNALSNRLARAISQHIKESSPNSDGDYIVAVCFQPSDRLIATLLAIWKAGAAYLPLDYGFPASRIEHIVNEARPVLVITEKDFDVNDIVQIKSYDELMEASKYLSSANLKEEEIVRHRDGNLAIVLYTSGSTGIPKGVRLPHDIILNRLQWQFHTFPYSETEKNCIFKTSLTFVDSACEIWGPLLKGLCIVIIPKKVTQDPEKLVKKIEEYKIERLVLVPSLLRSILLFLDLQKEINNPLAHLHLWVCSGEPLPISLAQDFFKRFPKDHYLCNFYGSTEIMGDVTYHVLENAEHLKERTKVPIGLPVDNTIIYLLDAQFHPVETGATGELWVSGANLAMGYVNGRDPDKFITNPLSNHPMHDRLYRTGDYAKIEKGAIVYEGRMDSQIKVRGHRVDLSEVERATLTVPGVDKAVVLCYHPGDEDQAILAFATLQNGHLMTEMQIENSLGDRLPAYMIPQVVIMENIPLLVNGKTDRQMLLKSYESTNNNDDFIVEVEIDYTGVSSTQMPAAKALLETVASVLNRQARAAVTIDANFYEIGGNSLNSIVTITKLKEKGYYISISDFIGASDLREVLDHMSPEKNIISTRTIESHKYTSESLSEEHREAVFEMITTSFYQKADLEQWLMPDIHETDYPELLEAMWDSLIEKGFSFVARRAEDGRLVGVALNFDAYDEPEVELNSKLSIIFDFLDYLEHPIKHKLPSGAGKIIHSSMMGTNPVLNAQENVSVMQYMEEENIRMARTKNYYGILTVNTSPLTQQFGRDVYGYQVLLDYQVNKYTLADGSKPFGKAPNTQRAMVCWKQI